MQGNSVAIFHTVTTILSTTNLLNHISSELRPRGTYTHFQSNHARYTKSTRYTSRKVRKCHILLTAMGNIFREFVQFFYFLPIKSLTQNMQHALAIFTVTANKADINIDV